MSFSGVLFISKPFQKTLHTKLKYLITLASGVFLATSINLIIESIHLSNLSTTLISVMIGFLGMSIIHNILPETHHHHKKDCNHPHIQTHGIKILIGDAIHNIADGIIITLAFSYSTQIGFITAIGIVLHEFTQEVSEFFVLRDAGFSNKKALTLNFLSSLTIVIGVLIGTNLSDNTLTQTILLSISAGMFLQILIHDLIPFKQFLQIQHKTNRPLLPLFFLGIGIIFTVRLLVPHSHEHENDHTYRNHNEPGFIEPSEDYHTEEQHSHDH